MMPIDRRAFLAGGLAAIGLAHVRATEAGTRRPAFSRYPFTLGVASGDPLHDSVVLWTRLAPDPLQGGGMPPSPVAVEWEMSADDRMRRIVRRGRVTARPDFAHAVHAEVSGLEPDRWYWYRFHAGNATSPVGRTRTLPRPGGTARRLRFGFASCQNYEMGFFTAYRHAAADDLDLMFHLGDYIYEQAGTPGRPRAHLGAELTTLAQYRTRHALYKTDPDLQAAHAQYPWVVTWDDHDVDNNYAGATSERHDPVDQFLERRAAAYQAYYEHTPLRRQSIPRGPFAQVYRQFSWGSLASFFVLDTRQYRSDQPCGDGGRAAPCEETRNPALTMLGEAQERWLFSGLDRSVSRWNILPQQVMMAKVDVRLGPEPRFSMDQWSGYDAARTRLLEFLGRRRPSNPVVLTGDIHSNWVNDLKVDFEDARSPVVATELVGTSISSGGDGADAPGGTADMLARNPFVKFHNGQRGYVRCEVTADVLYADYRVIDVVTAPGGLVTTRASFRIRSGTPGAEPA